MARNADMSTSSVRVLKSSVCAACHVQLRDAADVIVHAFKTPLGTIRQAAETLRRRGPRDDGACRMALEAIDCALDRLAVSADNARRFDEKIRDFLEPSSVSTRLGILISNVTKAVEADTLARGIDLEIAPGAVATITYGANLITAALEQLIDNALAFAPCGSKVTITTAFDSAGLSIAVRDHGPGVKDERVDHLFARGVTIRPTGKDEGFGLGLWLVKRNMDRLRGTVAAANAPGGGFVVTLGVPPVHFRISGR